MTGSLLLYLALAAQTENTAQSPAPLPTPARDEASMDASTAPAADLPDDASLRLRKLADDLAIFTKVLPRDPRYLRFAVVPFEVVEPGAGEKGLGLVVADAVATTWVRDYRFSLVERSRLKAVLDEQALQQLGVTDPDRAVELGKVANADLLVVGQVVKLGAEYRVTAKLIDVATASVKGVAETTLPVADLIALSSDAVVLRSKTDAAFRSLVLPGWGQHYNREPTKGWLFSGLTGGLLLTGIGFEVTGLALGQFYYKDWNPEDDGYTPGDPAIQRELNTRHDVAQMALNIGHVVLGATVLVWGYNVLDAYLSGVDGSTASVGD